MRARLACHNGRLRGESFEFEGEATIGRGIGNDIVLDDSQVSTRHARIWLDDQRQCYLLEDLDSLNGIEVDGVRVVHPESLPGLHVITFAGELDFVFQALAPPVAAENASTTNASLTTGAEWTLVVDRADGDLRFALPAGSHEIGRAAAADIQLESDQISRRHARLTVGRNRVSIIDLNSRNHTYVDGLEIDGEAELAPGTRLRFGKIEARLEDG